MKISSLKDLIEEVYSDFISCYLMAAFALWASLCTFFFSLGVFHSFIAGTSATTTALLLLLIVHLYIREL
jgi:hypothetical protein